MLQPAQHDLTSAILFQSFGWDSWQSSSNFYQFLQNQIPELQVSDLAVLRAQRYLRVQYSTQLGILRGSATSVGRADGVEVAL